MVRHIYYVYQKQLMVFIYCNLLHSINILLHIEYDINARYGIVILMVRDLLYIQNWRRLVHHHEKKIMDLAYAYFYSTCIFKY